MNLMTSPTIETVDLLDLKLLPAWVKEPAEARSYAHYSGEEDNGRRKAGHGPQRGKPKRRTSNIQHARQTDHIARHRETKPAPRLAVGTEPNIVPRRIVTLRLCERRQSRCVSSHTYLHSRM